MDILRILGPGIPIELAEPSRLVWFFDESGFPTNQKTIQEEVVVLTRELRVSKDVILLYGMIQEKMFVFLQQSGNGNATTSSLGFVPRIEDTNKTLTCKAETQGLPQSVLSSSWVLNIFRKYLA